MMRVVVGVVCLLFFAAVVMLIVRGRLLLKYALLWFALTLVTLLCAVYPAPLYRLASVIGFQAPSNFVFLIACFFLLMISISLSIIVSKQETSIKLLTQRIGILEKELGGVPSDDVQE